MYRNPVSDVVRVTALVCNVVSYVLTIHMDVQTLVHVHDIYIQDVDEAPTPVTTTITTTTVVTEEVKTASTTSTASHSIPSTSPIRTILSWNVNGIRAAAKKGAVEWLQKQDADVVCLTEIKVMSCAC